ncbi:hypothetical protein LCI18_011794 [Fusarium solani-melongenae]|uniref:Uncharacterized protein n=1 Tax=Fusarium solani subsp. cucurbitae TaxID=2747967 RepID=A0ACD3ZHS6_FUSSC|nr:hypothetical protein LCI18_011794 [Fusarium solani-melongenae]
MAEALGIASDVAGIVSLGIAICSGLDTFFSAIKDRDDDLKRATELLSLLRRYIELIRPTLGSCESELRALKEFVDNLNKVDGSSDMARRWDKSKSAITYPFQRKKLTQIQDKLLKATGALGTVIQALILHVGVGVGDDIEAFRSAVQNNHLVATAFLARLESKVERIEGSAEQTEASLTAISTGVEEQKTLASSSQTLIKDTSLMVSGKLDAIAEGLWLGPQAQTLGTAQQKDIPRYLRNSMIERKSIQEAAMAICLCQRQNGRKGRQPLTTYRLWGGLAISYQSMSKGDHQSGCCFYKRCTKTMITYTGLRFLLSKVVSFSLQRDYQCGGSLTTHSLRTYNVREMSPVFDVFDPFQNFGGGVNLTTFAREAIKKLQIAYTSGKASPLDANTHGYNAAHLCIWMMLLFLQQVGVNIYAGTNSDSPMIEFVLSEHSYTALGPVYDFLANCEWQFDPEPDPERPWGLKFVFKHGVINVLQGRPDIMEDEIRIKELIENTKFVEFVREAPFFGQNILHFCMNWETGLRLLLEKEATHHLVNQPDGEGFTPLKDALELSKLVCKQRTDLCSGCGCSATVRLLLEIDCPMGLDSIAETSEFRASPKAKIALLEHLAQRRERLQRLALHHLPELELRDLAVALNELPDMTAPAIWDRLQSLHQSGVVKVLHNGLDPLMPSELSDHVQQGILHLLDHPRDAEVAFNLGFKGIDTPNGDGVTPALRAGRPFTYEFTAEDQLAYADWLIQKGARLDYCANSLGISAAHDLARCCGEWVRGEFPKRRWCDQVPIHIGRVLLSVVQSAAQSRLPCPCTTEELSLPLHYLVVALLHDLEGTVTYFRYSDAIAKVIHFVDLLSRFVSDLDLAYLVKSIIHVLTLESLRIRHLPACHELGCATEDTVQRAKEVEEWDDMLDEDRALIERLGELTEEFEQDFSNQIVSIDDFLWLHWLPRMRQVCKERKALDERNRQELCELGVVLDEDIGQDMYYDSADTSEWENDFGDDDFGKGSGDGEVSENRSTQVKGNADKDNVG